MQPLKTKSEGAVFFFVGAGDCVVFLHNYVCDTGYVKVCVSDERSSSAISHATGAGSICVYYYISFGGLYFLFDGLDVVFDVGVVVDCPIFSWVFPGLREL